MGIKSMNFENHVETGKMENILDVTVHVDELEPAAGLAEPLLSCQKDAEPGTRYILKVLEIHRYRFCNFVQDLGCLFRLSRIQPAGKNDVALLIDANVEHAYSKGKRNEIVLIRFW